MAVFDNPLKRLDTPLKRVIGLLTALAFVSFVFAVTASDLLKNLAIELVGVFIGGGVIAYVFDRSLKQERELEWRATHEFFDTGIRRICFSVGNGIVRTSGLSDPRFNVFWTISPYVEHVK